MSTGEITILLNSTHKDPTNSNRFIYNFPTTVKFGKGDCVSLSAISIYNSFFNVQSSRANNTFSVMWNANTSIQHNFTIPDGSYSIPQLNYFLQYSCVQNNLYVTNSNGDFVYFLELVINASRYGAEVRAYALPTSATATTLGYTKPTAATWSFPGSAQTPQLIIPTTAMGSLIGHIAGTYPSSISASTQVNFSTVTPQIATVNALVMTLKLINSNYSIPPSLFESLPLKTSFGSILTFENRNNTKNRISEGTYSNIVIDFYDQLFNKLPIIDNEVTITLSLSIVA